MRRPLIRVSAVVSLLLALALVGPLAVGATVQDATPAATGAHPVVGTWLLDTDADDPDNAPEMVNFSADGGYISVDAEGFPSLGVWEATGERTATLTLASTGVDDEGAFEGTFIIRASVEVDAAGDAFTAEYTFEVVAADGSSAGEYGPGRAAAERVVAEAPGEPVGTLDDLFAAFEEGAGTPEAGTPEP